MAQASDRIMVTGLSLADAHSIQEQLRMRAGQLSQEYADWTADGPRGGTYMAVHDAILHEREQVAAAREALTAAIAATLNGLA